MSIAIQDPSSQSNLSEIKTTHLHLNWSISFENKNILGHVLLDLVTLKDNVDRVVLDTSFIDIHTITLEGTELNYELADQHASLGSALTIHLPKPFVDAGEAFQLRIDYATTEKCTAIQFLTAEQTVGKKLPYLFSQCEPIHARSFIPCQDSPSIKLTYSASVTSPLQVIMSALSTLSQPSALDSNLKTYGFEQRTTIPTYLIAIAAGNLDTEKFLSLGESLLTPYEWGRYDLLVLPPSFPYGGMENPCLTFLTPSLLAGDKSAVQVVAHEISHSWMGNLVTTRNWEHFWLNEGWTVFVERKIIGRLHGETSRQFSAIIGWKALKESVELFGQDSPATVLNTDLGSGINPDDYFSSVPYEKGFNLLYHIEGVVGGPSVFEPYMRSHVQKFAHKSITTQDWKSHLFEYMLEHNGQETVDKLNTIDFDLWLKGTGMPPVIPQFDTTLADMCYTLADRWDKARDEASLSQFSSTDLEEMSSLQKVVFLERLSDDKPLPHASLAKMDELYQMTPIRNADVRFRWQKLCLLASYEPIYPHVVAFVSEQGRMKFVRPLYRLLYRADNGAELARETFLKHKSFYHPIASTLVEKDIGLK
ncbi:hypothetical protein CLU79DRAFT_695144 [Phycomyces nitens]|nr:hypothetical protein CLU79DRAFT_695144 [Phycomyces nitens]